MGIIKTFGSLLGFGVAAAKSSHDLNKQARSPEVQQGIAEYRYLYDNPLPGHGFNYLLEFDVLHAKIREINATFDPVDLRYSSIFDLQRKWYQENCPQYVSAGYSFYEYVSECARKTAYDNGYTPSCLNRKRGRLPGYACDYSGKYPPTGLAGFKIDWDKGIPDQLERARVMHYDKTKELLSREEMFVRLREKSLDSNNPIPENIENTCKNNVSDERDSNTQPKRISSIRRTWDNRPCENCWNKMCCKFSLIKNPTAGTEVKDEDAARFIGNVCMENQMFGK